MRRAAIHGVVALMVLGLAGPPSAHAQDAGADYTRAIQIAETQPETAWAILRPLAEGGHAPSMAALGSMQASGLGVAPDFAAAREWYRRAAEAGSVTGIRAYGSMMLQGEGGPKDSTLGIALLVIAADAGDENAALLLSLVRADEDPGEKAVIAARDAWLRERLAE
jgi:TPR repeat protein